jgi:hypothetical protein
MLVYEDRERLRHVDAAMAETAGGNRWRKPKTKNGLLELPL